MSYKLDADQRARAIDLVEQIINDPESFAFEIIWLRDNTRQVIRDLLPWAKGCTTKSKERAAAVRRAEKALLQNEQADSVD